MCDDVSSFNDEFEDRVFTMIENQMLMMEEVLDSEDICSVMKSVFGRMLGNIFDHQRQFLALYMRFVDVNVPHTMDNLDQKMMDLMLPMMEKWEEEAERMEKEREEGIVPEDWWEEHSEEWRG